MLKMINWAFLLGLLIFVGMLIFALAAPENPFLDRPVLAGSALVWMADLVLWDEKNARYRLPSRLPAGAVLVFPVGLALFTATRVHWHAMEGPDFVQLGIGFSPLVHYLVRLLEARWKRHQMTD
ncbi:MAG TPA: hypothetical protein VNK89_04815 [Thermoflexus sp.]|nr:hypothetical protein [Thermoflexus sp.]